MSNQKNWGSKQWQVKYVNAPANSIVVAAMAISYAAKDHKLQNSKCKHL